MVDRWRTNAAIRQSLRFLGVAFLAALSMLPAASGQQNPDRDRDRDRDSHRDRDRDQDRDRSTRIETGTILAVRTKQGIDSDRRDYQVYTGIVDEDVRGDNGRLAIPRGSSVELIVRTNRDEDLIIDLESVTVNGQRYAIKTDPSRAESNRDDSLVGAIVGGLQGGETRGRAVRIPRDSVLNFRVRRPLDVAVPDRGRDRDGRHYHDPNNDSQ
jgi:hypothetical protein